MAASGTPMRPRDILRVAYLNRLVPSHLHGATQHKTLHARLSEDVSTYREASRFYRTGPGVFFLRRLRNDAMPVVGSEEFFAPPRKKELRRDWVMALRMSFGHSNDAKQISLQTIKGELDDGKFGYFPYSVVRREGSLLVRRFEEPSPSVRRSSSTASGLKDRAAFPRLATRKTLSRRWGTPKY